MRAIRIRYMWYFVFLIPFYIGSVTYMIQRDYDRIIRKETEDMIEMLEFTLLVFGTLKALIRLCESFVYYTLRDILQDLRIVKWYNNRKSDQNVSILMGKSSFQMNKESNSKEDPSKINNSNYVKFNG